VNAPASPATQTLRRSYAPEDTADESTPIVPAELKNEAGIVGAAIEIALQHDLAK